MQTVLSFGIHDLALQLFDLGLQLPTSEARQVSAEYLALIERLNTLTNEVRDIVRSYDKKSPIHRYMNRIMAVFADPADAANPNNRQYLSGAGENLRSFVVKIEHMKAAALTEEAIRGLVGLIDRSGCSVEKLEQLEYSPGLNIGTVLVAVRGEQ
jgi:hypothetical protein